MKNDQNKIEDLLIGYLSGDLSEEVKIIVDKWREEYEQRKNRQITFCDIPEKP